MNTELTIAYCRACDTPADINQHVPRLRSLAARCRHVTEFGVRYGVSTVGLLAGLSTAVAAEYVGYDLLATPKRRRLRQKAADNGIAYDHRQIDTLKAPPIDETDLLFIDTKHTFDQLAGELRRHAHRVRRFLAFHDTELYGKKGADRLAGGLMQAIEEFRNENPRWKTRKHYPENNGLTVLVATEADA